MTTNRLTRHTTARWRPIRTLSRRQPRLCTVLIGAGAALALAAGSTAAYAAIATPIDSSGVIHGCYYPATGGSHKVVLQDVGTRCPSGTTAIKWNQQGPPGPQGPPGVVHGYATSFGSNVSLGAGFTTVATLAVPAGNFLVTAKTVPNSNLLTARDLVTCALTDGSGAVIDQSYTLLAPAGASTFDIQTIALAGGTTTGGTIALECEDNLTEAQTGASVITAVPVVAVSAAPRHLPHLRTGARAGRLAG
jgi:hypothetical protein